MAFSLVSWVMEPMIAGALPVLTWTCGVGSGVCVAVAGVVEAGVVEAGVVEAGVVEVVEVVEAGMASRRSRIRRPALNLTVLLAGTGTRSRVLGFWAMRGALFLTSKTPKSRNSRRLPWAISSMTMSRNSCTICLVSTLFWPVRCAI